MNGRVSEGIIKGIEKASDIVTSTMGASGRTVIIGNSFGELRTTKDGVSVAKSIHFPDAFENMGAQLVISAAKKTVEEVGDGTTATTLILKELVGDIVLIPEGQINTEITNMDRAIKKVIAYLTTNKKEVSGLEDIRRIASISSSSEELGDLFKEVYADIGTNSLISLEISEHSNETYYEVIEGHSFNSGYVASTFANMPNGQCVFHNAYIHIDNSRHTNIDVYMDILEKNHAAGIPTVFISPEFSTEFIMLCKTNRTQKDVKVCLIKAPGYAQGQIENIKDIKSLLSEDRKVDKITVGPTSFLIVNEDAPLKEVRINELKSLTDHAIDSYEKDSYYKRMHNLSNTMAIIYAGGVTQESAKEEYDRIDDALGSVKAAIENGYLAGGGVALLNAGFNAGLDDNITGEKIIKKVCMKPIETILKNANLKDISKLLKKLNDVNIGYDVSNLENDNPEPINMIESGIIDPTDVIINSLKNAFATFKLVLKAEYSLYNQND